jgi:glycerol-3-phosphate dehydrogenase
VAARLTRDPAALTDTEFDVVVVGGGICGAAVAWDAAQRGLSVALLERDDFGGATSAESLKVVHGGIRYLQHLDVVRVRESAHERSALLRIAPHLVHPLPIVVPTYGHGLRGGEFLAAGFTLLGLLTADRNRGISDPARRIPGARLASRAQTLEWFPQLDRAGLTGAGVFWDGQMFNPPRLVLAFLVSAAAAGAVAANYCEAVSLLRSGNRVSGVRARDLFGGESFDVRARVVINAAGPYAHPFLDRSGLGGGHRVSLSRDMAFVIDRPPETPTHGLALQTSHRDPDAVLSRGNRHIFLLPWRGRTVVGVHSAIWRESPDALRVTEAEIAEFVAEIDQAAPHLGLTRRDVALVMAGLLPIGSGELVGEDVSFGKRPLVVDHARADGTEGLVSAVTNRYTVARGVAQRAVDLGFRKLGRTPPPCRTATTPLHGGDFPVFAVLAGEVAAAGPLDAAVAERIAHDHGTGYREVLSLAREAPAWGAPFPGTDVLPAEVVYAVRHEMARRLGDVVFRRTGLGTAGHPGEAALEACAALAASELGWNRAKTAAELDEVRARFRGFGAAPRD